MTFPWQPTGYPAIDRLGEEAGSLYQWAMRHNLNAFKPCALAEWAEHSVRHRHTGAENARLLPEISAMAFSLDIGQTPPPLPPGAALPAMAALAAQYLLIATKYLRERRTSIVTVAIDAANGALLLARQAKEEYLLDKGPRKGGLLHTHSNKAGILKEALPLLAAGHSKSNVARLLHGKHPDVPMGTIRDWLKESKDIKKTGGPEQPPG